MLVYKVQRILRIFKSRQLCPRRSFTDHIEQSFQSNPLIIHCYDLHFV